MGEFIQGAAYLKRLLDIARSRGPGDSLTLQGTTSLALSLSARIASAVDHFDVDEELAQVMLSWPGTVPRQVFRLGGK